eukprot:SAG11_NODE_9042_length_950_cov_0.877791_1_plen_70_part_00
MILPPAVEEKKQLTSGRAGRTGRYPWGIGYYDTTGTEPVGLDYTLMPELLQASGWQTAAIGKVGESFSL